MKFRLSAIIDCADITKAEIVANERLGHDEDYGFDYSVDIEQIEKAEAATIQMGNLNVCRIVSSDGKERHIIARVVPAMDGGMFEFHDPKSNEVVGCVGRNRAEEFVMPLDRWMENEAR